MPSLLGAIILLFGTVRRLRDARKTLTSRAAFISCRSSSGRTTRESCTTNPILAQVIGLRHVFRLLLALMRLRTFRASGERPTVGNESPSRQARLPTQGCCSRRLLLIHAAAPFSFSPETRTRPAKSAQLTVQSPWDDPQRRLSGTRSDLEAARAETIVLSLARFRADYRMVHLKCSVGGIASSR